MTTEQNTASNSRDRQIAACGYLLHGLLQRLDQQQPGLIAGMIEGVSNDQEQMRLIGTPAANEGVETAEVALGMLRLMSEQLKVANL
jgi:6,7-dimethyl-8-ribityllumazine synthase